MDTELWWCRFYAEIHRRSEALKGLPSPKYGFLGIIGAVSSRRMHRTVTQWADQYGPIFKARFLAFHVRPPIPCTTQE